MQAVNISGAKYDSSTQWPENFEPKGAVRVEDGWGRKLRRVLRSESLRGPFKDLYT
jgi:hypothetical protein